MKGPSLVFLWVFVALLKCQLLVATEHVGVAKHAIKLHRGKGATVTQGRQWVIENCRKMSGLLRQKAVVLNKLKGAIRAVEKNPGLSDAEKLFQVHTFEIFQKELNESENSVFQAIHGLQRVLQGGLQGCGEHEGEQQAAARGPAGGCHKVKLKGISTCAQEELRMIIFHIFLLLLIKQPVAFPEEMAKKVCSGNVEEQEFVELMAAEKHQAAALKSMQQQNKSLSILDEILEDVRKAADRLEEEIEEHAFDDNKLVKGVNVEAVLRVEDDDQDSRRNYSKREVEYDLGLSMLIDSQNNQYILTKPRDSTMPRADHHFIKDIVTVVMLSLPCGWLCTMIGLPTMFGYIICGVLLGPSGLNSIKVWKISVQGPCCMTFLMVAFGLLWGQLLRIRPAQTVFISTCLSLSSTPLVSRFLSGSTRGEKEGEIDYSSVLLGMLVMQDVQLSLFIAVMPSLIQAGGSNYNSVFMEILSIFILVGQILFSLAAVLLICVVIKAYLIGPYYRKLHAECKGNKEILVLGVSAFIFAMLMVVYPDTINCNTNCHCGSNR
ncbi:Transmembrane and coiled-coil domain-containing protein 3 [Acipenser ruthenus]|uniref:Transmembrane and coiled-coil domain-containing protein 3 n=1 Tax=Acipenser ruthenus TaxID=7906 RepID=A0A662Z1M0_ACIRT|nr:Transmembrane and coiled-coil domain-containing protein 3 [Acipenser ruthenus]